MLLRNMSSTSCKVYFGIIYILGIEITECFYYSNEELSKIIGSGISSTRKGLDDLVSYGILEETKRPGHTTIYKFIKEIDIMTQEELEEWKKDPNHYVTVYEAELEKKRQ